MNEYLVKGRTLPEAYHEALLLLHENGDVTDCADYNTRQKEVSMTICVAEPLGEPMISRLWFGGAYDLERYRQEMLDGIFDFEIARGNWAYTYHSRMVEPFDQIAFIVQELRRNPSSRRAVINIRDNAADMNSDDPACLQHIQYFLRNGALHCKVLFRSNDAVKATFMNAFALILIQKRIADELGVPVGTYTHRANSFHAYERDWAVLEGYCRRIADQDKNPVTYSYEEDYADMMEEARPDIEELIEKLRNEGAE